MCFMPPFLQERDEGEGKMQVEKRGAGDLLLAEILGFTHSQ